MYKFFIHKHRNFSYFPLLLFWLYCCILMCPLLGRNTCTIKPIQTSTSCFTTTYIWKFKVKKKSFYWTKSKVINETFLFKEFFISFRIVHTQAAWASNNNDIFLFGECNENKKKIRRLHTIQHSPFCTTKQKMDLNSHICVCLRRSWMKFALSYFARTN